MGNRYPTAGSLVTMNWGATGSFAARYEHGASGMCWGCPAPRQCGTWRPLAAAYQGRGRPPKPSWQSVTVRRHALAPDTWGHVTVRDGEKGPVGSRWSPDACRRVWNANARD